MKNKFAEFIKQYDDYYAVLKEFDAFVGNSEGMFRNKSGSSGQISELFHHSIQQSVTSILSAPLTTKVTSELEAIETNTKQKLKEDLEHILKEHVELSSDADFGPQEIVNHFVIELFEPLLSLGKEITKAVDSTGTMNSADQFKRKNEPS